MSVASRPHVDHLKAGAAAKVDHATNHLCWAFTGQIQADYGAFLEERHYTDIDSFFVRRARLGIDATIFRYYGFRLLPDFSNAQPSPPRPR